MTADGVRIRRAITPRQAEIVELYAEGLSTKEVAARLYVTSSHVLTTTSRAMQRVNATNRTHLTAMWARGELVVRDNRGHGNRDEKGHFLREDT